MKVIIIQPPLVQLNSPYPSGAYLKSFFSKELNLETEWHDLSLSLVYKIFSKKGLAKLFDLTENTALAKAEQFEKNGDTESAENIRRYIMQKNLWLDWIEVIVEILTGKINREYLHKFIFSPFVPRGMRMERYLESLERMPSVDDAHFLASCALADLADYINVVFDNNFTLIRYAESLTATEQTFTDFEKNIETPVLKEFYTGVLEDAFADYKTCREEKILVCITVPFAGTFASALFTGRWFKENFGRNVFVCLGGGFVNTELREVTDCAFSKYLDAFSYDRGYGSYLDFFSKANINEDGEWKFFAESFYKMRLIYNDKVLAQEETGKEIVCRENELTSKITPDYSDVDFSRYLRMVDDTNPMQRIWSDGTWLKAYLAHGCYWHRCAFCDTSLDYVKSFRITNVSLLYESLKNQCEKNNVKGIHFVDEAMPPVAMKEFALLNIKNNSALSWWGNVRFEKTFSKDLALLYSYGGLCAVSGGIEIATGRGLDAVNKGTDIDSIVSACCAFKEAGILIHAYMIYGYYNETALDIINSMETLRQLYAAGLLDSSFWHKFMLTRYSSLYCEWEQGKHKDLNPKHFNDEGLFAKNVLHFAGEEKSSCFGSGLNAALESWMHGEALERKVTKWFDFEVPKPTVPLDFVEKAILKYEEHCKKEENAPLVLDRLLWIGGNVWITKKRMHWYFMGQEESAAVVQNLSAEKIKLLLENPKSALKKEEIDFLRTLRGRGLIMV